MAEFDGSSCLNSPDDFCFICGHFLEASHKQPITEEVNEMYQKCFGYFYQKNFWSPNYVCDSCCSHLKQWKLDKTKQKLFLSPMIWRLPKSHPEDCYFCQTKVRTVDQKKGKQIEYPDVSSVTHPILDDKEGLDSKLDSGQRMVMLSQQALNDLIRCMNMSKSSSLFTIERMAKKTGMDLNNSIDSCKNRHREYEEFFYSQNDDEAFCINVGGLLQKFDIEHEPEQWRLCLDCPSNSLRGSIQHLENSRWPSILILYKSSILAEFNLANFLEKAHFFKHNWQLCADFKTISLAFGYDKEFIEKPCFLCQWDKKAKKEHWEKKVWPQRTVGQQVANGKTIDLNQICLAPLAIKVGLYEQFFRGLHLFSGARRYVESNYRSLAIGPTLPSYRIAVHKINILMRDEKFLDLLDYKERKAWTCFVNVSRNLVTSSRKKSFENDVQKMLNAFQDMRCEMSVEMHFLFSHLDYVKQTWEHLVDEKRDQDCHLDKRTFEKRIEQQKEKPNLAENCWFLVRETENPRHKQFRYISMY